MSPRLNLTDHEVEQIIGRLLQVGVLIAAAVVLVGAVLLLSHLGGTPASFSTFTAEPAGLSSIGGVWHGLLQGDTRAIVQAGLLLLIMTPVARVALTLVAFAIQRDKTYILVTAIVLVLLLYGLLYGKA